MNVDRIAEGFRRVGGDDAAAVARAFWEGEGGFDAMMAYATTCLPLYSPTPVDPDAQTRVQMNMDLLMDPGRYMRDMILLPGLASVRCPTLVIAGEDDPICPLEGMQDIVDALPAEHVRFERIPKAGHFANDDDPERFFGLVREFVVS